MIAGGDKPHTHQAKNRCEIRRGFCSTPKGFNNLAQGQRSATLGEVPNKLQYPERVT
jgi:hypothetical protein